MIIYPNRAKTTAVLVGALAFVAVGIAFACYQQELHLKPWTVFIASYVGVPFFGLCALYALYRLLDLRPALVLNPEGLFDNASALGVGLLRWEEIDGIVCYRYRGQAMLGIIPKDLRATLARQGLFKRSLLRLNRYLGCAPINIPEVILPMSVAELAARMEADYGVVWYLDS